MSAVYYLRNSPSFPLLNSMSNVVLKEIILFCERMLRPNRFGNFFMTASDAFIKNMACKAYDALLNGPICLF